MKVLLVYPKCPDTFWSFKHILSVISRKATQPPLGLLTVAAMLPEDWEKKLVDMNVSPLRDEDLQWADYVFLSAMTVQKSSVLDVISKANKIGVKVVAGGPLFTTEYEDFQEVDHLVLNEAEVTLPMFLRDLANGEARHLYTSTERPDLTKTPIPLWELLDAKKYATLNVQFSRGCPFDCEFCEISFLNGRKPRTKDANQFVRELNAIYESGWRGGIFVVDDNFIGNKRKLKTEVLPSLIKWSEARGYPFPLTTEASMNLADDEELMELMVKAGFNTVFLGIETPDEGSLAECGKLQNQKRDLIDSVRKIQNHGLQVQGGFIVGFDNDTPSIFQRQIEFIQGSGIVTAMVGILNAPRGSRLYERLKKENRLLKKPSGNNTDFSTNFIPKMEWGTLIDGYRRILDTIYSPKMFYERIRAFLRDYRPPQRKRPRIRVHDLWPIAKGLWLLGVRERGKRYFWKFLLSTLFKYRRSLREALSVSLYGAHFRRVGAGSGTRTT